jgi:hypothetical protein
MSARGHDAVSPRGSRGCVTQNDRADGRFFPPALAWHVVKLACERPDVVGWSLAQWDRVERARPLVHDGVVDEMSPQTVQRIVAHHTLKPWRHHVWLSPTVPRDAACAAQVQELVPLYTRPLGVWERRLCVDEKTSAHAPEFRGGEVLAPTESLPT